jgi:site-specific recombinase XerD
MVEVIENIERHAGKGREAFETDEFIQKAVRNAVSRAGLTKRITCHTSGHSFATHLIEGGCDIRTFQELPDHNDVKTTMIYTHDHNLNKCVNFRSYVVNSK